MAKNKEIPIKEPIIVGKRSIKMDMKAGKYFWCACGRSKKHPFCDGSHYQTGIKPVRVVLDEDQRVKWCACKKTKTPPFCDNTHREITE